MTGSGPATTTDINPSPLIHPTPLGIAPPSHPPLISSEEPDHHGRRFTSIVDSLPKEVKPLSPHSVLKRNMLLSGSDMHLHSAFQSQKNLPFPFLSGNNQHTPQFFNILLSFSSRTQFLPPILISLSLSKRNLTPGSHFIKKKQQPRSASFFQQ